MAASPLTVGQWLCTTSVEFSWSCSNLPIKCYWGTYTLLEYFHFIPIHPFKKLCTSYIVPLTPLHSPDSYTLQIHILKPAMCVYIWCSYTAAYNKPPSSIWSRQNLASAPWKCFSNNNPVKKYIHSFNTVTGSSVNGVLLLHFSMFLFTVTHRSQLPNNPSSDQTLVYFVPSHCTLYFNVWERDMTIV